MKKPSSTIVKALNGVEKCCIDEDRIVRSSIQVNYKLLRAIKLHCVIHQCTMTEFINAAMFRLALKEGVFNKDDF